MSKAIVITQENWKQLFDRIKAEYKPEVYLIRRKMKEVLGFTYREHTDHLQVYGFFFTVHLDFFNEAKRTMFLLKYGDTIKPLIATNRIIVKQE